MKRKISYLLIFSVLLIASCRTIGYQAIKPVVDVFFIPLRNDDLLNLQGALFYFRQLNNHWPTDVVELLDVNKNDSINVELINFSNLHWTTVGDSLLVEYKLDYDETDTIEYSYLSGKFYLAPNVDTLKVSHIIINAESNDGTFRFDSNPVNKKRKIKK